MTSVAVLLFLEITIIYFDSVNSAFMYGYPFYYYVKSIKKFYVELRCGIVPQDSKDNNIVFLVCIEIESYILVGCYVYQYVDVLHAKKFLKKTISS